MYEVHQETAVASFFLSLKMGMTRGWVAFFFSWELAWARAEAGCCRAGDGGGFKCVLLCLSMKMQIKILNSIRRLCMKSL